MKEMQSGYCKKDRKPKKMRFLSGFQRDFLSEKKSRIPYGTLLEVHKLIIFTFSSSFRFLFTSYAWLLIVFPFADLLLNASFCAVSFKSA